MHHHPTTQLHFYVFISGEDLEMANQSGLYRPASLDSEGFIHASPADQLQRVANKFYAATKDLRLLHIDPKLVESEIRWEPATGGLYPHIYGPLNITAVVKVTELGRDGEGNLAPELKD